MDNPNDCQNKLELLALKLINLANKRYKLTWYELREQVHELARLAQTIVSESLDEEEKKA